MYPAPFAYHKAASVDDAVALLREYGDGAKLIAGGHSLLPIMKLRLAEPEHLIDIGPIADLRGIRRDGLTLRIGALTSHHAIERSQELRELCPLLPEVAATIGDRQVRNRGTIGGSLAHADTAADFPAAILALEATMVAQGADGLREIPATDFFLGFLTTALEPDEVLTEIRVPTLPAHTGTSYQKLANQASGYATVGVAAVLTLDPSGRCQTLRLGITGAGAQASRASAVESALQGRPLDADSIRVAAEHADEGIDLLDDIHASAEYRRRILRGLTRRAVETAQARA